LELRRRAKVLYLCGEFGGHAGCRKEGVETVEAGLAALLSACGLCPTLPGVPPRPAGKSRFLQMEGIDHYVFAPRTGIFEPLFALGEHVEAGQLAARIHDPERRLDRPAEVRFAKAGVVLCIRSLATVQAGDCLGHLAVETAVPPV